MRRSSNLIVFTVSWTNAAVLFFEFWYWWHGQTLKRTLVTGILTVIFLNFVFWAAWRDMRR